jgi:hypothetical protein
MQNVLNAAQTAEQPVTIISTAETMPLSPQWMDAGQAAGTADEIIPEPWLANRTQALAALDMLEDAPSAPQIVWLSNGIDDEGARAFADALAGLGDLTIYSDDVSTEPLALRPPESAANGFAVTVLRGDTGGVRAGQVAALDGRGLVLETAPFQFGAGDAEATATIELPLELRNDTTRIIVQGAESAGSVQLMDSRYLRRPVGVVAGAGSNASVEQPLVSDLLYIERALQTYAEIRKGTLDQVIDSGIAVLVLADIGQLSDAERERVTAFVEAGGMLLRFAGPRIAALPPDDSLMPVRLRGGERLMGSALAWARSARKPAVLALARLLACTACATMVCVAALMPTGLNASSPQVCSRYVAMSQPGPARPPLATMRDASAITTKLAAMNSSAITNLPPDERSRLPSVIHSAENSGAKPMMKMELSD